MPLQTFTMQVNPSDALNPPNRPVKGVLGSWWEEISPGYLVQASLFVDKAHEFVDQILKEVSNPTKVGIQFAFNAMYAGTGARWEVKPEDLQKRRGWLLNRALDLEVRQMRDNALPDSIAVSYMTPDELEEYAYFRDNFRNNALEALRTVDVTLWR